MNSKKNTQQIPFEKSYKDRYRELYPLVKNKYEEAKRNYNQFLGNGIFSDDLIKSTIFLAKLDVFLRRRVMDDTIESCDNNDILDLRSLISIVPFSNFKAGQKCYLNPTFGQGSIMVGRADADVIIDDILYDLKVTKNLKLEREELNQIIGYYVLSQIGGINEDKPIKSIGIYFARHGIILKFSISDFNTPDKIHEFIEWFPRYMETKGSQLA